MPGRCYILCKILLDTMTDVLNSQMSKWELFVISHVPWEIESKGRVAPGSFGTALEQARSRAQ